MNKENFNPGLIPSPVDKRDIPLSAITPVPARIPEEMQPVFDLNILDQGSYPACVGYSCAAIKQERELRENISRVFDGKWIYDECKKIDGMPAVEGTYFRVGMKVLQSLGAKPMNGEEPSRYKIGSYSSVDDISFEGLKTAIFLYGSVLAGFKGSNAGWKEEIIRTPSPGEKTWGHAVALVGYNKESLIIQNSWGKEAGDNGYFYTTKSYLPFEAWVVLTDLPVPEPGITGWVAREYVFDYKTTARLNLRNGPSLTSTIIKVLPIGTKIKLIKSEGDWLNVEVL